MENWCYVQTQREGNYGVAARQGAVQHYLFIILPYRQPALNCIYRLFDLDAGYIKNIKIL